MTSNAAGAKAHVAQALADHRPALRAYARARVGPDEADDILQAAALRALENAGALREPERVLPWLYRIHSAVLVDAARKRGSERRMLEAVAVSVDVDASEAPPPAPCGCSLAQVESLKPAYAAILRLVDIGGQPVSRAADALNISVNNASVRLHRARAALKKRLFDHCGATSADNCAECRCVYEGCCGH